MTKRSPTGEISTGRTWYEAARIKDQLVSSECQLLEYIARLPFIWAAALHNVLGYADGTFVYRCLQRLRSFVRVTTRACYTSPTWAWLCWPCRVR